MRYLLAMCAAFVLAVNAGAYSSDLRVGPVAVQDGGVIQSRADRSGAQITQDAHGRYQEAAFRGAVFSLSTAAFTVLGANASQGALGTIAFIDGFYNPLQSGKAAVILTDIVSHTSGSPGGPMLWNYYCGLNITSIQTGQVNPIRSSLLSNSPANSGMINQSNVVLTATPAATPTALLYGVIGSSNTAVAEDIAGRIVVPPGCAFGIAATATGASDVVSAQIVWEEVPYP